ncbi:hypothetical protein [Anthocerotibacter panamensis]|uniref:hypothetical protein n=1 Tax=Anthocerotibacter panamensis TaxID=2857077 RepID=UPI001C404BAA|nr:hypothetical protein [Anthocerotibacter panamensis]
MGSPTRILLQTTIATPVDDWGIDRFSLLRDYLSGLRDAAGEIRFQVTARDRVADAQGDDPVLSSLDRTDFDELWLFAVDIGDGLSLRDCQGITAFWQQGGGVLATRDHHDLGSSLCGLGELGAMHFFHSRNPEPDPTRHCVDDCYTTHISWPNYHSGRNGDYQRILPLEPRHELLKRPEGGAIEFFPAHPHEGAVGIPEGLTGAQVIALGKSLVTERTFNLAVAFERGTDRTGHTLGRVVAESTFHHFCDYNWDSRAGSPSFVDEPPGDTMQKETQALADTHTYMYNLARWLAPLP